MVNEIKTFEARTKELVELGKKNDNKITFEELAEYLKGLDPDSDSLDKLYNTLVQNNIEVISTEAEKNDDADDSDDGLDLIEDISGNKDIKINDPVRMYLKEIGRINLLQKKEMKKQKEYLQNLTYV